MRKLLSWLLLPALGVFVIYLYFYLTAFLTATSYYDALILGDSKAVAKILFENSDNTRKNFSNKFTEALSWDDSSYLSYEIKGITFLEKGFNYPEVVVKIRKKDLAGVREYEERIALVKRGYGYTVNAITFSEDPLAKYRDQKPGEDLTDAEKQVLALNLYPAKISEVVVTDKFKHEVKYLPGKNEQEIKLLLKGIREGKPLTFKATENFNYTILIKIKGKDTKTNQEVQLDYNSDFNILKVSDKYFTASPAIKILLGNLNA